MFTGEAKHDVVTHPMPELKVEENEPKRPLLNSAIDKMYELYAKKFKPDEVSPVRHLRSIRHCKTCGKPMRGHSKVLCMPVDVEQFVGTQEDSNTYPVQGTEIPE